MFEFQNRAPFSSSFGDIYFSPDHGLEESRHVFIEGNQLVHRWKDKSCFVIGETGFGTGLNFLATWLCWQQSACRPDVLHYISTEKYPLTANQILQSHNLFPELAKISAELVEQYPLPHTGMHRIWLDQHRVCLTLCTMDVCAAFEEVEAKVDCWYLDGFAPSKNPEMWKSAVYRHLARLSNPGATIATFTAAGHVRRGLTEAGFNVSKIKGYGRKREMTVGTLGNPPRIRMIEPWRSTSTSTTNKKSVLIIGAGIAGAQVARNLAQRGFAVNILEQHSAPGQEASGNPRGVISPKLSAAPSIEEAFSISCYLAAIHQLSSLTPDQTGWSQCGVLHLATGEKKLKQWNSIADRALPYSLIRTMDAAEASDIAGIPLSQSALYFPGGGWISPRAIINALLDHPNITVHYSQHVERIEITDHGWKAELRHNNQKLVETLVITSGTTLSQLIPGSLPLDLVAGQTSFAESSTTTKSLRCVIQHDGYITPAQDNRHLLGATFQRGTGLQQADASLDQQNLKQLKAHLPEFASGLGKLTTAHTASRTTTPTRFPLVGAMPNPDFFSKAEAKKASGPVENLPYLPGLYIAGAFGSRGFTSAALAAEILCSEITGEPSPVEKSIHRAIEPVRWISR